MRFDVFYICVYSHLVIFCLQVVGGEMIVLRFLAVVFWEFLSLVGLSLWWGYYEEETFPIGMLVFVMCTAWACRSIIKLRKQLKQRKTYIFFMNGRKH